MVIKLFNKIYAKVKRFIKENYIFLICLVGIYLLFTIELPYVIYTPGGNINLNDRVEVDGSEESEGTYNMAFVTMFRGSIPFVLLSYVIPNWDLVSAEDITYEGQTLEQLFEIDKIYMESSVNSATILAYEKAGKEIVELEEYMNIVYIDKLSKTNLEIGDRIISVDDTYTTYDEIIEYLTTKEVGEDYQITVLRDGKEVKTTSEVIELDGEPKIGIVFISTYEYSTSPQLDVKVKSDESGPSGGLMLTLSIYDALIEEDLTKGLKIVGTGTIDINGNVGQIDGVKYKMLGSKDADIFLCPEENYEEAIKVKEENDLTMEVYKVKTFDEAVKILQ